MIVADDSPKLDELRLMQVVLSLGPGGTERLVIDMTRWLVDHGAHVIVCCLDEPGGWANELTDRGIKVIPLKRETGFHPSLSRRIVKLAKDHDINVLHCHHYSPFIYGELAHLQLRGTKLVYTEHGRLSDAPPSAKRKLANALFGRLPGHFVAVSHALREHLLAEGFPAKRMGVVHNGIDPGESTTDAARTAARKKLHMPGDAHVIGTVARLDPVKDLPTLIDAFARIAGDRPDARLVIVGDGDERKRLEGIARKRGVKEQVRFTGRRDDVRDILCAFDVYVNCSITEGISVTILEAMAANVAVIATRVGGTPEIITDGENGIMIPARDPRALAHEMGKLIDDDYRRDKLAAAGRAHVEQAFAMSRMVGEYLESYGIEVGA